MSPFPSGRRHGSTATLPPARLVAFVIVLFVLSTPATFRPALAEVAPPPEDTSSADPATDEDVKRVIATIKTGTPDAQAAASREIARLVRDNIIPNDDPRAISALEGLLLEGHGDASYAARGALVTIGPPALPSALKAVASENATASYYGAGLLWELARANPENDALLKSVAEAMIKHVHDDNLSMRQMAIQALGHTGERGVPALIEALHGPVPQSKRRLPDNSPQQRASKALAAIGQPAVGPLAEALRSDDVTTRRYAVRTLARIDLNARMAARDSLIAALDDPDDYVWMSAAVTLGDIDVPAAREVFDRLFAQWREEPDNPNAVYLLSNIGIEVGHIDAVIEIAARSKSSRVEEDVPDALATAGEPAVPRLIALISDDNPRVRRIAIHALRHLGPKAKAAVGPLVEALQSEEEWSSAAMALGAIGPEAKDAVPALIKSLSRGSLYPTTMKDQYQLVSPGAVALAQIGPAALPAILDALDSDDAMTRAGCYESLALRAAAGAEGRLGYSPDIAFSPAERTQVLQAMGVALGDETDDRLRRIALRVFIPNPPPTDKGREGGAER